MGSVAIDDHDYSSNGEFVVLEDCRPEDTSLQAFMVSKPRGFLPRAEPVWQLPADFQPLEDLLQRMPVKTITGEPGLLAHGKLGAVVESEFPDLTWAVDKHKDNMPLMNALYRDYSFLLSAYLLEPCHERFLRGEPYGLGRQVLPAVVAKPMARVAELYVCFFFFLSAELSLFPYHLYFHACRLTRYVCPLIGLSRTWVHFSHVA